MKAKPSKYRCLALAFDVATNSYRQKDPMIRIGPYQVTSIGADSFKFLGRYISGDLKDKCQ